MVSAELMEKRLPHYDLTSIQATFSTLSGLNLTVSAAREAGRLGFSRADIVSVVQSITRAHFYKSMTSLASPRIWQDVYHVPARGLVLYVKFTVDTRGHLLISFKEK